MVKIRFSKLGKKHQTTYRIVVCNTREKQTSKFIDVIGFYNPNVKPPFSQIEKEKLKIWLSRGAKISPSLKKILTNEEIA